MQKTNARGFSFSFVFFRLEAPQHPYFCQVMYRQLPARSAILPHMRGICDCRRHRSGTGRPAHHGVPAAVRAFSAGRCWISTVSPAATTCSPSRGILEVGVHIRSGHWNRGYALEATRAMVMAYAFDTLSAAALFAGHNPTNVGSRRLLTKLGFRYTHDKFYEPTGLHHPSSPPPRNSPGWGTAGSNGCRGAGWSRRTCRRPLPKTPSPSALMKYD